jgi:hypothetical protein
MISKTCTALIATVLAIGIHSTTSASCSNAWASCGSDSTDPTCCPDNYYCQPWDAGFYQCIEAPTQCQQQLVNTDFYGNDIKTIYGLQPGACCTQCTTTDGCVAYTFVNSNPGNTACYLKSGSNDRRTKKGAVSGIVSNSPAAPAQCKKQLSDTDLYGDDLKTINGIQGSECCTECAVTTSCVAYTFVSGNTASDNACYLKKGMGQQKTKTGAISGVVNNASVSPSPNDTTSSPTPTTTTTPTPTPTPTPSSSTCDTPNWGSCGSSSGSKCCPEGYYCQPWSTSYYQCIQPPQQCGAQQTDMDFDGNDIKTVYVSLPSLCCEECAKTDGCKAYTYINDNPGKPVCYLKSKAGTPTRLVGAVAGKLN